MGPESQSRRIINDTVYPSNRRAKEREREREREREEERESVSVEVTIPD